MTGSTPPVAAPGASSAAESFASRLPYVRVVVNWPDDTPRPRNPAEMHDVFADGVMRRSHKSPRSRQIEERLGVSDVLYLHAGRTHPDYGQAVFVLRGLDVDHTATPFGIGALCCRRAEAAADPDVEDVCEGGGCMCPLACRSDRTQAAFVQSWTWDRTSWRQRAAQILDEYFAPDLARYFAWDDTARPNRPSPEGLYDPARANGRMHDWRGSTIEIQALEDVDLRTHLAQDRVMLWGYSPKLAGYLGLDTVRTPYLPDPAEAYPLLVDLDPLPPVTDGGTDEGDWLEHVDAIIQGYVLGSDR